MGKTWFSDIYIAKSNKMYVDVLILSQWNYSSKTPMKISMTNIYWSKYNQF